MRKIAKFIFFIIVVQTFIEHSTLAKSTPTGFQRIKYNHPGLVVDLGVGLWAWPLPMDYDGDGDNDLLVSCPDKPYNGIYFFENTQGKVKMPVFKPGVRLGDSWRNIQISYVKGRPRILVPGQELIDFRQNRFQKTLDIYPAKKLGQENGRIRANQWKYVDYDEDGALDLIVGLGDWGDYGWDNAYNDRGVWTNGPLHGYVFLLKNNGTTENPDYASPLKLTCASGFIDVFGMPSPNFADFDKDGDLDLICGEFLDKFTWFENTGTPTKPEYAAGRYLTYNHEPIRMDLEMIIPVAFDWDLDGDIDLIVGQEDGRVAFLENTGALVEGMPQFLPPRWFRQQAEDVKFGALVTPVSVDWDGDGDDDLICGNTAGYIGFIENLDGRNPPQWNAPQYLAANGEVIRIQAGYHGSIQGPCEAKWGYTTLSVTDWNADGLLDLVVNSIWGKVVWYRNMGPQENPRLAEALPIQIYRTDLPQKPAWYWWEPLDKHFVTQWRTTPFATDLTGDGRTDLVMLDQEGYLALFEMAGSGNLPQILEGKRIFKEKISSAAADSLELLRLNRRTAGKSGRRKFCLVDWDRDGKLDLLVNSRNIDFMRNIATNEGEFIFENQGEVTDHLLAGHSTSPTIVDWDKNNVPDLLVGAEDGFLYYLKNPFE